VKENEILRVVAAKLLIPFILLFAFYVQFHGDFGPGGGFQAGVIFGAGVILYGLIYGLAAARRIVPPVVAQTLSAVGVLIYAGVGVACLLEGGNFLEYNVLNAHEPTHGQHLGINVIELGVGLAVASTMILIYYAFAGRERVQT